MKRIYIVVGVILILGASLAIEYYTESRFPVTPITIFNVPSLEIGETHSFSYTKEMTNVGTYSYTVTGLEGSLYTMTSSTDVTEGGNNIKLDSSFVFDTGYNPEDYRLRVDHEGELNLINVTFTDTQVISTVVFANETVTLSDEITEEVVMVENNMPGFWEILLSSADLEQGKRYTIDAYIPQGGDVFELEFYVNPNTQTITVDGERLSCIVIQESTLDLRFYFNEERMVQMRNDDQDLTFTLTN